MNDPVIELRGVSKRFGKTYDAAARLARGLRRSLGGEVKDQVVRAVDNIDLTIHKGEVVGLVGESGCGKSTIGRMVSGIMPPSDGTVHWHGRDITAMPLDAMRRATLKVQMIFQDPYASLDPRRAIGAYRSVLLTPEGGRAPQVPLECRRPPAR